MRHPRAPALLLAALVLALPGSFLALVATPRTLTARIDRVSDGDSVTDTARVPSAGCSSLSPAATQTRRAPTHRPGARP